MEPCLFRHGKGYDDRPGDDPEDASMEPCLFRHGKGIFVLRGAPGPGGFNGAMSFQTW